MQEREPPKEEYLSVHSSQCRQIHTQFLSHPHLNFGENYEEEKKEREKITFYISFLYKFARKCLTE